MAQGDTIPGITTLSGGASVTLQPPSGTTYKYFGIPGHYWTYSGNEYLMWEIYKYDGSTEVPHGSRQGNDTDREGDWIGAITNDTGDYGQHHMPSLIATDSAYMRVYNGENDSSNTLCYEGVQLK